MFIQDSQYLYKLGSLEKQHSMLSKVDMFVYSWFTLKERIM